MNKLLVPIFVFCFITATSAQKNYTQFIQDLNHTIHNHKLPYYHYSYDQLAYLVDTFGPRLWGSSNLERAIDWMHKLAINNSFDNVRLEPVKNFTKWVRGQESLTMISPRPIASKLQVIGLGYSVAGNITGEVIVIENWDQLEVLKRQVNGKVVLFNHPWVNYSVNVDYRVNGASRAAKYGAIGVLVRSVTPSSIGSVHTGYMEYDKTVPRIPAAAITIEDADMFKRMQNRGQKIIVNLVLHNQFIQGCNSHNLIFEIVGTTHPDQIVLAGGHIDSWDTGSQTGANDDGGGFMNVFSALRLLKGLGLRPKRTIRFIAWSGQESGSPVDGAAQYLQNHLDQLDKHVVGFQSDNGGSFELVGFAHTGEGQDIIRSILHDYMSLIGAGRFSPHGASADVQPLHVAGGVSMLRNLPKDTDDQANYFRYHHTAGDTMSIMDPDDMDSNVLGIAGMLYIVADLDRTLRNIANQNLRKISDS